MYIPIIILILFAWIVVLIIIVYSIKSKKYRVLETATIFFDFNIDDKTFKIKKPNNMNLIMPFWSSKTLHKYIKKYHPISDLECLFNNKSLMKNINNIFYKFEKEGVNFHSFSCSSVSNIPKIKIYFKFSKISSVLGKGKIIWKEKEIFSRFIDDDFKNIIEKQRYINTRMYVLKVVPSVQDDYIYFIIDEIKRSTYSKIFIFKKKQQLYFIVMSNNKNIVIKDHEVLKKIFHEKVFNNYRRILAIGYLPISNIKLTNSIMEENILKLDFVVYKETTINKNNINFSLFDIDSCKSEYYEYIKLNNLLESTLTNNNISVKKSKIYNINTKKRTGTIAIPIIKDKIKHDFKIIIYKNWESKMIDALAKKIIVDENIMDLGKGTIIKLNMDWLLLNYRLIHNSNFLYLISLSTTNKLSDLIIIFKYLYDNNRIKCGIKISNNTNIDKSVLKKLKIFFILIDYDIASRANESIGFSNILLINQIFKNTNIKTIYENPTIKLDEILQKKLKVKYAVFYK